MNTQPIDATTAPPTISQPTEAIHLPISTVPISKAKPKFKKSMPGPKMGSRPSDFDERVVRMAPTFKKWSALEEGQKLRYACRDFIKGKGNDEERLMRRIMIARRNNLRDHELLKKARNRSSNTNGNADIATDSKPTEKIQEPPDENTNNKHKAESVNGGLLGPLIRKRPKTTNGMTDLQVKLEMDELAVESTRSYKAWLTLGEGVEFTYNQTYVRGKEGHDWLLKKNIWRRMRYRRQNKQMIDKMKGKLQERTDDSLFQNMDYLNPTDSNEQLHEENNNIQDAEQNVLEMGHDAVPNETNDDPSASNSSAIDAAVAAAATVGVTASMDLVNNDIVEAAVAAAVSYVKDMPKEENAQPGTEEINEPDATDTAELPQINIPQDEVPPVSDSPEIPLELEEVQNISMV